MTTDPKSATPRSDQAGTMAIATLQISGLPAEAIKEVLDEARTLERELADCRAELAEWRKVCAHDTPDETAKGIQQLYTRWQNAESRLATHAEREGTEPEWNLIDRAYKMMQMAGYGIASHDTEHNNPIIAWMADVRLLKASRG